MVKKKVYISFDFQNDRAFKNELVAASQAEGANFKIANWSTKPANIDPKWLKETKYHISRCDAFVVVIGVNTKTAKGVRHELDIAENIGKLIIPLLAHPQNTLPKGIIEAHDWSPNTLTALLK